ncbi:MAG: hypothetical protein L0312_17765, partial [Acidobacteria bacterium]|nr:hypothetical protein [Acidobacteriota bacterium]
ENKKIIELPMNGRNYLDLARLTPGVAQATGFVGGISIHGGGTQSGNLIQLDGVDNFEIPSGRPNILPSLDMIQEFKIQTSNYTAEQGRAGIGQINVISKGGTNALHGSVYEFHRNAAVTALNFFDESREVRKSKGLPEVPPFIRNQFGASIGGPIKRNKTFFFGNYEGTIIRQIARGILTVPDPLIRAGDFSGRSVTIYDPLTLDPATGQRRPFAGNRIPANRIHPISAKILGFTPPPNAPGLVGNYNANVTQRDNIHQFTGKVDHNFSESDILSVRYTFNQRDSLVPGFLGSVLFPGFGENQNYPAQNLSIQETHIISPKTVNQLLLGYNRFFQNRFHEHQGTNVAKELGLAGPSGIPEGQLIGGWPALSVAGFSMPHEHQFAPLYQSDNTYQFYDKLSHELTRHSLKVGIEYTHKSAPLDFHRNDRGSYGFSPRFSTSAPLASGGPEHAFADFLLGYPATAFRLLGYPTSTSLQNWWSGFVHDDWRLHPSLTLNLGLRYELWSGVYERMDRFSTFLPSKVAFVLVGKDGVPRTGFNRDTNNFAPRFGFAWRVFGNNKTVLRGGYGISYDYRPTDNFYSMAGGPPLVVSDSRTNAPDVPIISWDNLFPGGVTDIPAQSGGVAIDPGFKVGYVQQWSLNVQREILANTVIDIGYVANRGIKNVALQNLNFVRPGPGLAQNRQTYPAFGGITWTSNPGMSWHDSLQARVERRFASGFTFLSAYTWANSLAIGSVPGTQNEEQGFRNPTNFGSDKGPGPFDIRHRLVVSSVFELPFGKGKHFLSGASGALNTLVGGWQVSGIATFQTGPAVTPFLAFDNSNAGGNRPDVIRDPNNGPKTIQQWFDIGAFTNPPTLASVLSSGGDPYRAQGNSGRGIIRGPGLNLFDLAVMKRFSLFESHSVQFRAEFFNAFNHPNFGSPVAQFPVVPNFTGRIFGTSTPARQIQFGLRYEF